MTENILRRCVAAACGLDRPELELDCGHRIRVSRRQFENRQYRYPCPTCAEKREQDPPRVEPRSAGHAVLSGIFCPYGCMVGDPVSQPLTHQVECHAPPGAGEVRARFPCARCHRMIRVRCPLPIHGERPTIEGEDDVTT